MIRHSVVVGVLTTLCFSPSLASAEIARNIARSVGFAMELDLEVSPIGTANYLDAPITQAGHVSPQLTLGAQIRRFFVGVSIGITYYGEKDGLDNELPDDMEFELWIINLGPRLDGEVWGTERAALYLGGGVDLVMYRNDDDDYGANGFEFDFFVGGRVYILPQLAMGLRIGNKLGAVFTMIKRLGPDYARRNLTWTFYGALDFRFIATR